MTDPLALDPVLPERERSRLTFSERRPAARRALSALRGARPGGGKVEATDWMPDEYRTAVLRFVEMHANSELMGVLPEREWIMRAPTLRRKLALTAKVQDEVGHAQLLYRVAEDLGKPREAMFDDLLAGKTKFHNVFHYPTGSWADIGIIAWLVDAAAIVAQQALRDSSYAPYARTMQKICWEESVHIMHGRDVVVTLMTGTPTQRAMVQEALDRWWGPLMQMHGPRSDRAKDRDLHWRIKAKTSEELRQEFLTIYVPRLLELGLTIPTRSSASTRRRRAWSYTEPDWAELRSVVTEPRPEVPGAARVPARSTARRRPGSATRSSRATGGRLTGMAEPRSARARRPRALGGLPPGEGRRPDAPRRQRPGARSRPSPSTTPGRCTAGARRASACGSSGGRTSTTSTTRTCSSRRSTARSRSPAAT